MMNRKEEECERPVLTRWFQSECLSWCEVAWCKGCGAKHVRDKRTLEEVT